jgi:DNA ligase 1
MNRLMLAPNDLIDTITAKYPMQWPMLGSAKIDGNRIAVREKTAITRSAKRAPNMFLHEMLGFDAFHGLDGELTVGAPNAEDVYIKTQESRRIKDRPTDEPWTLNVFDLFDMPGLPYEHRYEVLQEKFATTLRDTPFLNLVEQRLINNQEECDAYEEEELSNIYEGIMLRKPASPYKYGRCTAKEGYILKVKRFEHDEAEVVGFEELMINTNAAYIAENGYQKRSTAAEGMVAGGTLGALICREIKTGIIFNVGSGFTAAQRAEIWANRDSWVSETIRFKHFPVGRKDAPRFPIYAGTRDEDDIL